MALPEAVQRERPGPSQAALNDLKARLRGPLIAPGDAEYDVVRRVYNGMIDRYPRLIARCRDVADVISAVNFGRDAGADHRSFACVERSEAVGVESFGVGPDGSRSDVVLEARAPLDRKRVTASARGARVSPRLTAARRRYTRNPSHQTTSGPSSIFLERVRR